MKPELINAVVVDSVRPYRLALDFGVGGSGMECTLEGWSRPERKYRWMIGAESGLRIEQQFSAVDHILEIELRPYLAPPQLVAQTLHIFVNGHEIAQTKIEREGRYGYRIPAAALAGGLTHSIVLRHPDAVRPCDVHDSRDRRFLTLGMANLWLSPARAGAAGVRRPGIRGISEAATQQLVGMDAARMILNFESLGNDCEFGLVQRACGAEPMFSLLRFARIELATLRRALERGLTDFAHPSNIKIRVEDGKRRECMIQEGRYGIEFHTFRGQDDCEAPSLVAKESKRLAYCARRLLADIRSQKKIFVLKRSDPLREEEVLPLFALLATYGDNDLLWVVPEDAEHASGTVEVLLPGFYKGYLERFADAENPSDLLLGAWLEICANAYLLRFRERGATGSG